MSKNCLLLGVILFVSAFCLARGAETNIFSNEGVPVRLQGAELGQWSMDMGAAKALAQKKKLPLLLAFTGSDWCKYCKMVFQNVFSKPEWPAYASNRFVLVNIDLPRGSNGIPESVLEKNRDLAKSMEVNGLPAFYVLGQDGTNVLSQFGMSPDMNVIGFTKELVTSLRTQPDRVANLVQGLPAEKAAEYRKLLEEFKKANTELETWIATKPEMNATNDAAMKQYRERIEKTTTAIEAFEVNKVMAEVAGAKAESQNVLLKRAEIYAKLAEELNSARLDLTNWLLSRPENNDASRTTFESLTRRVEDLEAKIANVTPGGH